MRFICIFLLAVLVSSCGGGSSGNSLSTNACADLGLPTKNLKIINGEACGALDTSPIVRLIMYDATDNPLGLCTGTMITRKDILTAAHCAVRGTVSAGVIYGDIGSTKVASVNTIKRHPGYVPLGGTPGSGAAFNDIAVYSLKSEINLPTLPIATTSQVSAGDIIDIFGYGVDENGTLDFKELRSGQMLIDSVTENHISTLFDGDGSNTCQGDSGGPAIITIGGLPALVGVTSTGTQEQCLEGDNSLFINLQSQSALNFILSVAPAAATL